MEGVGWGMKGMQDLHGRLTATDLVCNAVWLILQLMWSPIGNQNFRKKIKHNIANEGTPHIVHSKIVTSLVGKKDNS